MGTMYPTTLTQLARSNPFSAPLFSLQQVEEPKQKLHHGESTGRVLAAASAEGDSCEFGSQKYFMLCGFGGIVSCGITHTAVVPLDLVKCRMQVDPEKYKSIGNGFKVTPCLAPNCRKSWASPPFAGVGGTFNQLA